MSEQNKEQEQLPEKNKAKEPIVQVKYRVSEIEQKQLGSVSVCSVNGQTAYFGSLPIVVDIIELEPVSPQFGQEIQNQNGDVTYKTPSTIPSLTLSIGDPALAKQFYPGRIYTLTLSSD